MIPTSWATHHESRIQSWIHNLMNLKGLSLSTNYILKTRTLLSRYLKNTLINKKQQFGGSKRNQDNRLVEAVSGVSLKQRQYTEHLHLFSFTKFKCLGRHWRLHVCNTQYFKDEGTGSPERAAVSRITSNCFPAWVTEQDLSFKLEITHTLLTMETMRSTQHMSTAHSTNCNPDFLAQWRKHEDNLSAVMLLVLQLRRVSGCFLDMHVWQSLHGSTSISRSLLHSVITKPLSSVQRFSKVDQCHFCMSTQQKLSGKQANLCVVL